MRPIRVVSLHAANVRAPPVGYREPDAPDPRPVILTGAVLWALATIGAFTIATLKDWRPVTIAGLGVSVLGVSIFVWQRSAARRGARGAQTGLE
jgi:hypothetical protein